ncbi:MAG: UvrD-helicase domain-containing protein [Proteobacteria bacterium]|nr:UvrD-helicase domain-containing protein [Pseudomonadota bacterium]
MNGRQGDARARSRAQREFERPLVLEAGAGTGKTATLVARLVAWCTGPGWERARSRTEAGTDPDRLAADVLERVVAITFTEAAAAEMAERTADALAALASGASPDWLDAEAVPREAADFAGRVEALQDQLDRLTICTIHAFCRRLLAEFPLESGLHPAFEVDADERALEAAARHAVETVVHEGYARAEPSALLTLGTAGIGAQALEEALLFLLRAGASAQALRQDPLAPGRIEPVHRELMAGLAALLQAEGGRIGSKSGRVAGALELLEAVRATAAALEGAPGDRTALTTACEELRVRWPDAPLGRLKRWSRGDFTATEADHLDGAAQAVTAAAAPLADALDPWRTLDPELFDAARSVLVELAVRTEAELHHQGRVLFPWLLGRARDLLRDDPGLCRRVRRRVDQLLVDEVQDTDPLQYEILEALALAGPPDERPGLFAVGDPKQSIYGWRNADLGAYEAFVSRVEAEGGERHALRVNFRSAPPILSEVERVVAPVMAARPGLQVAFEPLLACDAKRESRGFQGSGRAPVEHWISWALDSDTGVPRPRTSAGEAKAVEARALALDLRARHDRDGVAWDRFGVLLRNTGDLETYLTALRAEAIPYVVERDRNYYRRREVIDAAAWVRAVVDPMDHVALLAVLRSPGVGVPDAALVPLWAESLPALCARLPEAGEELWREIQAAVDAAGAGLGEGVPGFERVRGFEVSLRAALETLATLRRSFERDPGDVFVERLRTLTQIEVLEGSRYLGAYRAANLERFFRELAELLASGGHPQHVLRELRRAIEGEQEAEEEKPGDAAGEAVRILTVHGAKGLDFEHVYLIQLHKRAAGAIPWVDAGLGPRGWELCLFGMRTPGFATVAVHRREREAAERVRLLYVGMTRARERLVLMGRWPNPESPARAGDDLASLVAQRVPAPPDLVHLAEQCVRTGEPASRDGVLYAYPALADVRQEDLPLAADGPSPFPPAESIAEVVRETLKRREQAHLRERRAFGEPMSAASHAELEATVPGAGDEASSADRAQALAAGTAVHRALEAFCFDADPDRELARLRALLPGWVRGDQSGAGEVAARALETLDRFGGSPLFARFVALGDRIVARELPVWLAPDDDRPPEPVGYRSGAIDLVYRAPEDGGWVVADYKSDRVEAGALPERAEAYRGQVMAYARALGAALGLETRPRAELWFLEAGRVAVLEDDHVDIV